MNLTLLFIAVNAEFFKVGIILLIIGGLLMGFVSGVRKLFTKNKKKFFLYVLVVMLLFAATALLSNENVLNNLPISNFISFQVVFLCLGVLHVIAMRSIFPDLSKTITLFWSEFVYTIVTLCLGLIVFLFIVDMYKPEYKYIFSASTICFLVPFAVLKLYEFAVSVPVPIYKKWMYPIDKKISDPKKDELENPRVISFEFNKGKAMDEISNFRLKVAGRSPFAVFGWLRRAATWASSDR